MACLRSTREHLSIDGIRGTAVDGDLNRAIDILLFFSSHLDPNACRFYRLSVSFAGDSKYRSGTLFLFHVVNYAFGVVLCRESVEIDVLIPNLGFGELLRYSLGEESGRVISVQPTVVCLDRN